MAASSARGLFPAAGSFKHYKDSVLTCCWLDDIEQECQLLNMNGTSVLKEGIFRVSSRCSIHQMLSVAITGADCQLSTEALSYHIAMMGNAAFK